MEPIKACTRCKGTGKRVKYTGETAACYCCGGRGFFDAPDIGQILQAIICTKGANKGRLLKAQPAQSKGVRAYFVWRLARFHGGADVCMPVCAEMDIEGDPYKQELDALSEAVARRAFGTDMAAADRWMGALVVPQEPTSVTSRNRPNITSTNTTSFQ